MTAKTEEKKEVYTNDQVHVSVHRKPNCVVEYEVEAYRPLCYEAQKKASKEIGKEVTVPGFRKGKAPPEIVSKRYPHDLDRKFQEELANLSYVQCAQLANVPLINKDGQISFKMQSHSKDQAKLTLIFETIPTIPMVDPANCVLIEVKRPEVSDEKVDETIRQVQMFFGKWKSIQPRPIVEGDFVILDVEILDEDPPKKLFTHTRFEVTDRSMAQWMKNAILGKKPGDHVDAISEPDPGLSEEEKQDYPPRNVRVAIRSIDEVELPELNEGFVKQVGVDTIEILRKRIEDLLNKKADEHVREEKRKQVTEFLLAQPFEIPHSVIEKEVRFRLEQMVHDQSFKRDWESSTDQQRRELIDNVKKHAEKAVRIFYLCRKIVADQNISVTAKDVPNPPQDLVETLLYPNTQQHDPRQPDVKQAESYSRNLLEKTEDWIIAHARTSSGKKAKAKEEPVVMESGKGAKEEAVEKEEAKSAPKRKGAAKKEKESEEGASESKPKTKTAPKAKKA